MACKAIGARTLTRRLNPDSGPYTAALALGSFASETAWDIRFSFSVIEDGGDGCSGEIYYETNRDGNGWVPMSVAAGTAFVSVALPDTDYDRAFFPDVPGAYQYRVRVEYTDGPWYSSIGTATVYAATVEGLPNADITSSGPGRVVGSEPATAAAGSSAPASVCGSAVATAETSSHAAEGTVG